MDENQTKQLFSDVAELLSIIDEFYPLHSDGTFDAESVKNCTLRLIDRIVSNKEEGEALKDWLQKTDFFTGPASTRFHGNFEGGLAVHTLKVLHQALLFAQPVIENYQFCPLKEKYTITAEDIFVACLSHDFVKANCYKIEFRNSKDIFGNWVKKPMYKTRDENRNLGHGNESVLILLELMPSFIKKRYVLEAISRHMGFSDLSETETYNYSNFLDNPLVILLQLADQTAAQWYNL